MRRDLKTSPDAIEFLYGRMFSYLTKDAQRLFVAISQLVTEDDLTNLVEKLRYIANMENDEAKFLRALEELKKLRLVELYESDFFRVYSQEIFQIMQRYFDQAEKQFRSGVISRIKQVTRDKKLDNERALLENANSARYARSEEETISLYRQILNRTSSPYGI